MYKQGGNFTTQQLYNFTILQLEFNMFDKKMNFRSEAPETPFNSLKSVFNLHAVDFQFIGKSNICQKCHFKLFKDMF